MAEEHPVKKPNIPPSDSVQWSPDFPREPGWYWFYGDQHQGQMGAHYRDPAPPIEPTMQLVEVFEVSNGIMGKCDGHFFGSKRFNKAKGVPGYVGYFAKADLPVPPQDHLNLFK